MHIDIAIGEDRQAFFVIRETGERIENLVFARHEMNVPTRRVENVFGQSFDFQGGPAEIRAEVVGFDMGLRTSVRGPDPVSPEDMHRSGIRLNASLRSTVSAPAPRRPLPEPTEVQMRAAFQTQTISIPIIPASEIDETYRLLAASNPGDSADRESFTRRMLRERSMVGSILPSIPFTDTEDQSAAAEPLEQNVDPPYHGNIFPELDDEVDQIQSTYATDEIDEIQEGFLEIGRPSEIVDEMLKELEAKNYSEVTVILLTVATYGTEMLDSVWKEFLEHLNLESSDKLTDFLQSAKATEAWRLFAVGTGRESWTADQWLTFARERERSKCAPSICLKQVEQIETEDTLLSTT